MGSNDVWDKSSTVLRAINASFDLHNVGCSEPAMSELADGNRHPHPGAEVETSQKS